MLSFTASIIQYNLNGLFYQKLNFLLGGRIRIFYIVGTVTFWREARLVVVGQRVRIKMTILVSLSIQHSMFVFAEHVF